MRLDLQRLNLKQCTLASILSVIRVWEVFLFTPFFYFYTLSKQSLKSYVALGTEACLYEAEINLTFSYVSIHFQAKLKKLRCDCALKLVFTRQKQTLFQSFFVFNPAKENFESHIAVDSKTFLLAIFRLLEHQPTIFFKLFDIIGFRKRGNIGKELCRSINFTRLNTFWYFKFTRCLWMQFHILCHKVFKGRTS